MENDILYSTNEDGNIYVVIEFRSGSDRDMAYFENKKYIGTDSDYYRIKNYDYDDYKAGIITDSEYEEILNKQISFATARLQVAYWNLMAKAGGVRFGRGSFGWRKKNRKKTWNTLPEVMDKIICFFEDERRR